MALIGYVRCSTNRQMVLQQIDALRAAGCLHIYKDRAVRATAKKRPGLLAVRKALKPGDTFVITSIDRAFRSTIDAIIFLDDITNLDIARASKIRANLPEIHFSRGINRVSIQNLLLWMCFSMYFGRNYDRKEVFIC